MELVLFADTLRPNSVTIDQNGSSSGSSTSSMSVTPTRSTTDLPNRVGNTARREDGELLYNGVVEENASSPRPPSSICQQNHVQQRKQWWESNYKEAAIFLEVRIARIAKKSTLPLKSLSFLFLQEGENNDKFSHHPRSYDHLPAYLLVHNKWFNSLDLGAALILLSLGLVEAPCLEVMILVVLCRLSKVHIPLLKICFYFRSFKFPSKSTVALNYAHLS